MKRLGALLLLAACSTPPAAVPQDETLNRLGHAGDIAMDLEHPGDAIAQYRLALDRARARDDAEATADAGYNLAVAQLGANDPASALQTAQDIRAELARRGLTDAGLDLVTATALFREGHLNESDRWAAGLAGKATVADKAAFLRGLIADARGDRPGLARSEAALGPAADAADRAELRARLGHDPALAIQAADLRRNALDYRGMARALALAAGLTADRARAADLYLRAGAVLRPSMIMAKPEHG